MELLETKVVDALRFMVGIFNKHNVPYRIGGGFGAKIYGSPRPLNDIDFGIPDKYFSIIVPEISEYITFGPKHCNDDGKWDCYTTSLDYHGQEIDITGTDTLKMSNKERTRWIPRNTDFSDCLDMNVGGISVKVMNPNELVQYKRELDGEHQLIDIAAIEKYIANN